MILARYINRQLFQATLVVAFVLVMVLVSGRFIKYLADAAAGEIAADVLFELMFYRLPGFLELILPLSMFIALLLVLGRMYVDNEMAVLGACGIGTGRVLTMLALPILSMTLLVGFFTLYLTPYGDRQVADIFERQESRSALELLTPGRFHVTGKRGDSRATYAQRLDREAGLLENVFIADQRFGGGSMRMVLAESGKIVSQDGVRYLQLHHGRQYSGEAGQPEYQEIQFERYLIRLDQAAPEFPKIRLQGWRTGDLLESPNPAAVGEWQWRMSVMLMVPVVMLMAVPFARVSPRQGRFVRMIPALLLFLMYFALIVTGKSRIQHLAMEAVPWYFNLWWVHLLFALFVMSLYRWPRFWRLGGGA